MCHAQQDAASHQPRQDIELSSCVKAPTNRAAPRNLYLALQSIGLRLTVLLRKVRYLSRRLASRGTRSEGGHPFFAVAGASPRQRDHALQSTIPPVLSFVKDGRLRGIATTGLERDPVLPELPTIAEAGWRASTCRFGSASPPPREPRARSSRSWRRRSTRRLPCRTSRRR